jgi:hypothetical protein
MSDWLRKILESKRAMRQRLAALPLADKIKLLEQLRDRSRMIGATPLKQKSSGRG